MRVRFVTGNASKVAETAAIIRSLRASQPDAGLPAFDLVHEVMPDIPEIQDLNVEIVARHKALAAFAAVGEPVVVEDTGLYIRAWGRLPGSFIRFFLAELGQEGILRMFQGFPDRRARAETAFAYCDAGGVVTGTGVVQGWIAETARGALGFGWDSLFIPAPGYPMDLMQAPAGLPTYAEVAESAKNAASMRRAAISHLLAQLAAPGKT